MEEKKGAFSLPPHYMCSYQYTPVPQSWEKTFPGSEIAPGQRVGQGREDPLTPVPTDYSWDMALGKVTLIGNWNQISREYKKEHEEKLNKDVQGPEGV